MRYFKLSDGRTVTCRDAQAVSTLIKWGRENKVGLSEVYWYKTPDGKDWTVDAWAKNNGALDNPKLKGAMDMGAKEAHDHPFVRGDQATIQARKPGEAGLTPSHEKTFIEKAWDVVKHPLKAGIRTALGPVGSVVDLYAGAAKLVSGNDKNKANPIYQDPEPPRWVQEPLNRRNEAVTNLENLSVSRPPAEAPELESAWKQQYDSTLAEAEKQEEIYLFRATGLTEAQREYKEETATWAKKHPLLATLSQLPTGFEALYKAPANVMAAGGAIDTGKGWWYAKRQGLAEGLAEAGKGWSDWGSALYSFGLTMPSYVATLSISLSGGATAPVAGPLIIAAASARELSSMSDNLRDSYFNDGVLSTNELWAGATNAFIEEGIETIGLNLQAGTFANAYKLGGTAGMHKAIATQLGKKAMPGLAQGGLTFMTMYGEELGEEILTNVGQMVVNNVMLGTPLPTREELQQQFRDTAVQTLYGTILQGGVSVGYTVRQSQSQMRKLTALSDKKLGWSSPKMALDAINQLKAFDIEGAKATAMKAQKTLIKDDAAMDDKAKKVVAQAIGNVLDASLKYDMQTAEGVYVEQKAVQKTLDRLEAEQKQLEQDKPSPERDQRLFDIGEQIEELQRESIRIDGLITENAQQKEIYNLLVEGSQAEKKARKAGDKAVDKLVKTKEYKEATPEQQRQMMKDAVLSDKKSAKLQEKADQKYRDAALYKLRQTSEYKQAAPEAQAQMEEAELQRQQEARDADIKAAEQRAISEQQEAEKTSQTQPTEATEDNEVVPDIIDQLEAKKAALRQERQDINKELNEYRKLMDQQGGWLPSVTPEQKKAYHEVKKRQKEVNRKLNEVGIEIRKEKAARKKAEREAQKPKKKVDKKDTKKDTAESEDKDGQKDKERTPGNQRQDTKSDEQQLDDRGESAGTGQADRQGGQDEDGEAGAEEKPKQRKTYVKTKSGGKTRVFEATRIDGKWIYYVNERGTESRTKRNPRTQTTNDPLVYRKWKSEHANRSRGAQRAAQKRDRRITMSQKVLDSMPNLAALQGRVFPPGEAGDLKNVFIPGYGPLCRESKNDQEWTYDTIYENSIPTPEGAQASRDADYKPILEAAEKELDRWYDGRQTQDTDYWDDAQKAQEEIEYYEKELDKATTEEERQLIRQKLTELDGRVFDDYTEAEQMEMEEAESDGVELNDQGYPASWDEVGTDTRTKSEALQETLPTIPDKTADDALLGMVKSHILSITRKDRTTTVNFKDGRKLVINHITQEAMLTEAGKTGVMYAGRTQGEKGKNVYKAIVDLVDGLNQGNRTLFHESFHVVWKLFLNSEQISYINQYYRAKANKGELVRKYVVTRQGTEMALYWTKEQFNALNRERQAEALEEGAAYGFEHWLGSRTDTAPTTMIGKLWQRLADAIRHALVKLNLASQNAKLTDIFHAVASDKLTGQGEQGAETRNMVANAYHGGPHAFDKFDENFVGTGEGNAAFGWGAAYASESRGVGEYYSRMGEPPRTVVKYAGKTYDNKRTESLKQYFDKQQEREGVNSKYEQNDAWWMKYILAYDSVSLSKLGVDGYIKELRDGIERHKYYYTENSYQAKNTTHKLSAIEKYKDSVEFEQTEGNRNLYQVDLWPDRQEDVLEWYGKPTQEQIDKIALQFAKEGRKGAETFLAEMKTGEELYHTVGHRLRLAKNDKVTSKFLLRAGIDGIKYPVNALSGGKSEKGYNYVVFDADQIQIKDHTRYKPVPTAAEIAEAERQYAEVEAKYRGADIWSRPGQQEFTSAKTSINKGKLPRVFTLINDWVSGTKNADIGGGKYDNATEYLSEKGVTNYVIDPYNRSDEHNTLATNAVRGGQADTATVSNTLNVVMEAENRDKIIAQAADAIKQDGVAFFTFYEDPKQEARQTSEDSWQEFRRAETYIPEISRHFADVQRQGGMIIAKDPIKGVPVMANTTAPLKTINGSTIKRYNNNVGKEIGGQVYVHKQYAADIIPQEIYDNAVAVLEGKHQGFEYNTVVYDKKTDAIRFDQSANFDTAREPFAGDYVWVYPNGETKAGHTESIWHHKWLWVKDNYSGFNVSDSYNWSETWLKSISNPSGSNEIWNKQLRDSGVKETNKSQWLKAPNGKPSNLNERQWVQVRTQAFKDWFGDWENDPKNASKVLDENGEPMVVYHGMPIDNSEKFNGIFKMGHDAQRIQGGYFTAEAEYSTRYTKTKGEKTGTIYPVFLSIKNPATDTVMDKLSYHLDGLQARDKLSADGYDGVDHKYLNEYIAFSPTQIKSATANVGTFDQSNPDIRYRKLNDRERAMWDDVWNEIMGRKPVPRVQTRPMVAELPPEEKRRISPALVKDNSLIPKPVLNRDRNTGLLHTQEDIELADRIKTIAAELGVDDKNSDEKFDRIVAAARRQAQRSWLMTMETEELRSVVRNIIETNKPAQTDRTDMVLHNEEALDLMRELGVNTDQLRRAGVDGYTLFLQNLAEFAYGNELIEQREALYDELAKTPMGEEGRIASIREGIKTLCGLIDESRVVNKNMGSLSGRILQGMKMMNRQQLRQAIRTQERIRGDREQIVNNIEELRKQQEITRQKLHNLQKSFAALMEVVNRRLNTNPNVRHKEFGDMSDIERQREMLAMEAEERALQAELDNFDAQIQGEINRLKVTNEREAEISKEIDTLKPKKKGKMIRITDIKPRTPNAEDIIKAVFYNSILSSPSTHAVNIVSTASNVFIEGLINDLTTPGSTHIDIRKTIKEALKEMGNELMDKGKDPQKYAEAQSRALQAGNRYGSPKDRAKFWAWWALNLNMRLMSMEDTYFYVLTRERQLANLAYAKAASETKNRAERNRRAELYYAKPDTDMVIQAEYEAKHATFNKMPEGTLGRLVTGMGKLYTDLSESHGLVGKMGAIAMRMSIMPFTKVVGNVANTWVNYIPILGHIQAYKYKQIGKDGQLDPNTMMNRQRNIWKNEDGTLRVSPYRMRDFHRQIMRAHIGTALTALMAMFAWGLLTKDDDDPEEEYYELKKMAGYISGAGPKNYNLTKDMNAAFGYQTNSVRVVGTDIWLPWSDWPVAGVFAVIGTLHDYTTWRKPERPVNFVGAMTTIMMGVAKQFLDKQFLSNMAESMDAVRSGDQKWMQRTSMNILTNPVNPNALRFFRKCFDGQAYGAETLEEQLRLSLWFGKREGYLPEKLNVAGKPERQAAPYYRFFSTAKPDEYFDYVDENDTAHNLRNMVMKFAAKGVAVSRVRGYEIALPQGGNIWLTGKDQEDFAKLRTGLLNALLITNESELLKLADGSDTKKLQNKLRGLASKATKEAKKTMLEDLNATTMKFRTDGHSYKDDVYSIPKEEEE